MLMGERQVLGQSDCLELSFLNDYVSMFVFDEGYDVAHFRLELLSYPPRQGDSESGLYAAIRDYPVHEPIAEWVFGRSYYAVEYHNGTCFRAPNDDGGFPSRIAKQGLLYSLSPSIFFSVSNPRAA